MKKAIIYLRVSTEEQAEKGFSISAQRDECTQKAHELECEDIAEYVDEGISGSILERPMLMNAIEALKNDKIDFFICFDSSRLSRNVSHQLILIDTIKKHQTKLVFVRSNFEDTAEGRFQITIMAAVDEYERARLKIRTELGKRAKAKQKLLTHNPGLYGYKFDKDMDILNINETQAQIVKMMYNWLLYDGLGPTEIAKKLNEMQILSMRKKEWSRVSVNRILNNFSYTGTLYIRRYDTRDYKLNKYKRKDQKVKIIERPQNEWIPITIPSIIDLNTWQKAKLQLEKAKRVYKKGTKEPYLLSGLLRCEVCGGTIHGRSTYKNKYYCCINKYNYIKSKNERCESKLYKVEELDKIIWDLAKSWLLNKEQIYKIIGEKSNPTISGIDIEGLRKLLSEKDKEKQRLLNLYQKDIIDETELNSRLADITKATVDLSEACKRAVELLNISQKFKNKFELNKMEAYLEEMDILNKNKLLHILIKEILINEKTLKIKTLVPDNLNNYNL